ncbi:HzsA-related protein [Thermopirellula anaerolimosa]
MTSPRFDRYVFYAALSMMVLAWTAAAQADGPSAYPDDPAEQAQLEEDWRKQDGIETPREAVTYQQAVAVLWGRIERLVQYLSEREKLPEGLRTRYEALRSDSDRLADGATEESAWREMWLAVHRLRRDLMFSAAEVHRGPIVFIKQVPSMFSHQLTQYQGSTARPGGGVFVLDRPGTSLACRPLFDAGFPQGSYQFLDVSHDGERVLFSYCEVPSIPVNREECMDRAYHLYEWSRADGSVRRLTDGPFDDFAGRYLPDGRIVFLSTRRGGYHRCGRGPCPVHVLTLAEADGSNPRPISFHETHEWDPAVLHDGRIIYTRWDYVDRHAVFYQMLWTARPDGTGVAAFYGNNTWNPVGVWEARPVPGSHRVMATAAAHHAMTAGSIILIDPERGSDGLEPLERLTPDALFPESEVPVANLSREEYWWAGVVDRSRIEVPVEARRWPGHCYRSPWPFSESFFLAAYSFDRLIGEPDPNPPAMFGVYLCDRFGNKELLHRDPAISSLWAMPLAPRERPVNLAVLDDGVREEPRSALAPSDQVERVTRPVSMTGADRASATDSAGQASRAKPQAARAFGTLILQNVYASWKPLPAVPIRRLRIVQVLPKATPHVNDPMVGLAHASPGKQVLGTVPVEEDGSAYFTVPAGVPIAFQALDEHGRAVQTMRSLTYVQPGETLSCVGCHEPRHVAPSVSRPPLALRREPSTITPGPEGSKPLSFPRLVQPILDRQCAACHGDEKAEGGLNLVGRPEGAFTVAYIQLAAKVPFSAWNGGHPAANAEPATPPDHFGSRACRWFDDLIAGRHFGVQLTPEEVEALATWMDANALFYGTFDRDLQARQLRGEIIPGPGLE